MDRTLAYFAGCLVLLGVALFFTKMVYELIRQPSAFARGQRLMALFCVAQGLSIAAFIVSLVFGIEGLWQASGITVAALFFASWFMPKPF